MFAKRKNRGNIRKRSGADDSDNEDDGATVVKKNKLNTGSALSFSTAKDSKQEVEGVVLRHESDKTIQQRGDGGATRHLETETAYDRDARAIREKVLKQGRGEEAPQDGKYRGMAAYVDYRKVDYKPDLCKDYKETGYCSYGDSCKFLHDRSDYKSGWELEREWEAEQKRKMERMANSVAGAGDGDEDADEDEDGDDDDELPFACAICRRSWAEAKDPVVTRCGHYFCEQCALRHHAAKKGRCFLCESATNGIFNVATDILKRMKQQGNQPPGRTGPGG